MPLTETLAVTKKIVDIFSQLNIKCIVGGSVASSLHGIPRATQDVDVVVQLFPNQVSKLVAILNEQFYVDQNAVVEAVARSSSFNVIHLETMYKVDVFVCGDDELKREEISRSVSVVIDEKTKDTILIADASDIIIQKLIWYELGNRVSDRQWRDVLGVIKVSGDALDMEYLKKWAKKKGVFELLELALKE